MFTDKTYAPFLVAKIAANFCVPHPLAQMFSVWTEFTGAGTRLTPSHPATPAGNPWDWHATLWIGASALSQSRHLGTKSSFWGRLAHTFSAATKCGDLRWTPVQIHLPNSLFPHSNPVHAWGPALRRPQQRWPQNNSFQESYPVWPSACCQVSWCVYFSSLSLAHTGPAIKGRELKYAQLIHSQLLWVLPKSVKKIKMCTTISSVKFILAEPKVALVTQKELVWGEDFIILSPTSIPIPCMHTFVSFSVNSFSPILALWKMPSMSNRTLCDDGKVTYMMTIEHSKCDTEKQKCLVKEPRVADGGWTGQHRLALSFTIKEMTLRCSPEAKEEFM